MKYCTNNITMASSGQEELEQFASEQLEVARRLRNKYIDVLKYLLQNTTGAQQKAEIRLQIFKLKFDFIVLKGRVNKKLAEINERNQRSDNQRGNNWRRHEL